MMYDMIIIGGGLAGSALAVLLSQTNLRTAVLEQGAYPRDKLCGEFLSPHAIPLLHHLNTYDAVTEQGAVPITRAQFVTPSKTRVRFDLPRAGIGISRRSLDALLFQKACESGCDVFDNTQALSIEDMPAGKRVHIKSNRNEERLETKLVVLAHGKRGHLDRELQRPFLNKRQPFTGCKQHGVFTNPDEYDDAVEMYVFPGGYCGICRVENGLSNVCMLLHQHVLQSVAKPVTWQTLREGLLGMNPALDERLQSFTPSDSPLLATAQIPFVNKECVRDNILFIGDAAGMTSPLCGNGQTFALQSAFQLAKILQPYSHNLDAEHIPQIAAAWRQDWTASLQRKIRWSRWLQTIAMNPSLSYYLWHGLSLFPAGLRPLFRLTHGSSEC